MEKSGLLLWYVIVKKVLFVEVCRHGVTCHSVTADVNLLIFYQYQETNNHHSSCAMLIFGGKHAGIEIVKLYYTVQDATGTFWLSLRDVTEWHIIPDL